MKRSIILMLTIIQFANLYGQTCSPDSLLLRSIKAIETDSNINWELQNHQVYINNDCTQNDKLVIHLVGTFGNPASTTYFPTLAANNGFKVINLKYPNGTAAVTACANSNDINCFQGYRQEIIFGVDSSSIVTVDENNCVINRIEKLVTYLNNNFPSENWDEFLSTPGNLNWSNIVVSGHSQGGGHAAFIAKQFEVNSALMFASPNDYSDFFSAPANWLSLPSATPDSNYFAFGNLFDNVVDFNKQFENWTAMNLLLQTDSTNVDHTTCNYNNSKVLYTKYETPTGAGNHSAVITDDFTPLSGGTATFAPVWEYMLGLCEVATSVSETNDYPNNIRFFPNPTSSKVRIESSNKISKVEIFNLSGILLRTVRPFQENFELNVESYKGVIFLNMTLQDSKIERCERVIVN
jgi:hypothetical protein